MRKKYAKGNNEYLVGVSLRHINWDDTVFEVTLYVRLKGKRKWMSFVDTDDYRYRNLGIKERIEERKTKITSEIPFEWIEEVKQMEIDRISKSEYEY